MKITYYGKNCFLIKEKDLSILMDPYASMTPLSAGAVTLSDKENQAEALKAVSGNPKIFNWPGEYETKQVLFQGIASFHNPKESEDQKENTIFMIEFDGVRLCHLGSLGTRLTSEQLEKAGEVDVLFIPVGGKQSIDAKKAKEVVEQVEPRIIIPMAYCDKEEECGLGPLQPFLTEMGVQNAEPLEEFSLKKSELPEDNSKVMVLKNF